MLFAILVCGFTAMTMASCGSDDDDDPVKPNPQETSGDNDQKPSQDDSSANEDMLKTPLTLEAIEAGTITFANRAAGPVTYRVNGGEAQTIESTKKGEITVVKGDKVAFFGDNAVYALDISRASHIACSAECYVYGNIMSLVSSSDFATANKLEGGRNFFCLFTKEGLRENYIKNHPSYQLMLPATTLAERCYEFMFSSCTGLTEAPELPATTLAERCYRNMFAGCTGLTKAPELPATTLAENCYDEMFKGCTGLTKAPELPATTLELNCYCNMFWNCTNLNSVTCLATDISAYGATEGWLGAVSHTGTFTKAKGVEWQTGASGIPEGWTVVER